MLVFIKAKSLLLLTISLSTAIFSFPVPPIFAQTSAVPPPAKEQLELSLLAPNAAVNNGVITASNISQKQLTIPSIWWAKEQFGGKLLDNWLAYPPTDNRTPRIDLIVNRQIWSLLDYVERYKFVNNFGNVARDYGYNVRVFNYQQELLATYTCNFEVQPRLCTMANLDALGKASVRGSRAINN
jgi:hypothetical protein